MGYFEDTLRDWKKKQERLAIPILVVKPTHKLVFNKETGQYEKRPLDEDSEKR